MPPDVVVVRVLEYSPYLEASVNTLLGTAPPNFPPGYTDCPGALDFVSGANISIVSLDPLTRLEEVAEDLVENSNIVKASGWVRTLDPQQANQFPLFTSPVCGIRKLVLLMDIRQSLPMWFIFRSSKSISGVGGGGGRGVRTDIEKR